MVDDLMDIYVPSADEKKHKSPTRRLIQHKDSTVAHKSKISKTLNKGEYS